MGSMHSVAAIYTPCWKIEASAHKNSEIEGKQTVNLNSLAEEAKLFWKYSFKLDFEALLSQRQFQVWTDHNFPDSLTR